jgi:ribosomal protein S18 acetylase RimI-like enzyme
MVKTASQGTAMPRPVRQSDQQLADIRRVERDGWIDALSHLAISGRQGSRQVAQRLVALADRDGIDLSHLWAGYDPRGEITDVVLVIGRPGRTGMVFVSQPKRQRHVPRSGRFIDEICRRLPTDQFNILQALLDPNEHAQQSTLRAGGFEVLARLAYLQRPIDASLPEDEGSDPSVRFEPWSEERRDVFMDVLQRSYEQTLDCPALQGMRSIEDIMAGHMSVGQFDPSLWTVMYVNDEPVGVTLLNPVPDQQCVELVYLGLAAPFRGRGLGRCMLGHALAQCRATNLPRITLAVDEANKPADRLYRRSGFRVATRKLAMIRQIDNRNAPAGDA